MQISLSKALDWVQNTWEDKVVHPNHQEAVFVDAAPHHDLIETKGLAASTYREKETTVTDAGHLWWSKNVVTNHTSDDTSAQIAIKNNKDGVSAAVTVDGENKEVTIRDLAKNEQYVLSANGFLTHTKNGATDYTSLPALESGMDLSFDYAKTIQISGAKISLDTVVGDNNANPIVKIENFSTKEVITARTDTSDEGVGGVWVDYSTKTGPAKVIAAPINDGSKIKGKIVESGFGDKVDKLIAESPTLTRQLTDLKMEGWDFKFGKSGGGTRTDHSKKVIFLDPQDDNKTAASIVASLAHEAGHATNEFSQDVSSKTAFVKQYLNDEAIATLNQIQIDSEIHSVKLDLPGKHAKEYQRIGEQYLDNGNANLAIRKIAKLYGEGEIASVGGKPYSDYYGDAYDDSKKKTG